MKSNNLAWVRYSAQSMGLSRDEYRLMTIGEIQDLSICKAIASGSMEEAIMVSSWDDIRRAR